MPTQFRVSTLLILSILLFASTIAWAATYHATVRLKDGTTVEGILKQMTVTAIGIDPQGPVSYRMIPAEQIESVYIKELDQTFTFPIKPEEIPSVFLRRAQTSRPGFVPPPSGRFGFGFTGGYASSMTDAAIKGFESTEFGGGRIIGGSLFYKFARGFTLELSVSHFKMTLSETGDNLGALQLIPILVLLKYQAMPYREVGFTYHGEIGGGAYSTGFVKGEFLTQLESFGARFKIETDNPFVFAIGGGVDYFVSKNACFTLDGRSLIGNIGTNWQVLGPAASVPLEGVDNFFASNFQILFGLRVWLPSQ